MKYQKRIETVVGSMVIVEEDGCIIKLNIHQIDGENEVIFKDTELLMKAEKQIQQYFRKERKEFDLPLAPKGTEFQEKVWKELCNIPYGEIRSYQEIAIAVGSPKGARAIGLANHSNPIPLLIPCHRVIGKNGKMVGFGLGIDLKEKILQLEGYL